jgi:tetratricopeptide (TPR) repeat protein
MRFLTLTTFFASLLIFQLVSKSPCGASNNEKEDESNLSSKKSQVIMETSYFSLKDDEWNNLPEEVWVHIFDQLSFRDLQKAQEVCGKWKRIGDDERLSFSKQILKKPLSVTLWKLEDSNDGKDGLYQKFFASAEARRKLLLEPIAIGNMLRNSFLLPHLFESEITALEIYQALHTNILTPDQQIELEAYAKTAPVYPAEQSILSQEFVDFAKAYASHYKALHLLFLFNLPSGKPINEVLRGIGKNINLDDITEDQSISLVKGVNYFSDIPLEMTDNMVEYCCSKYTKAERIGNETSKNVWLGFIDVISRKYANQDNTIAQYNLSMRLLDEGKHAEAEIFLRRIANHGDARAQGCLGWYLEKLGKFEEALENYEKASNQGDKFACLDLACLLENHPELFKGSQAELHHRIAQLHDKAKLSLEEWSKARGGVVTLTQEEYIFPGYKAL